MQATAFKTLWISFWISIAGLPSSAMALPVTFTGLDASHQKLIAEKLPQFNAANASLESIDNLIRVLMLTGAFERVVADKTSDAITITATPLRLIGLSEVTGNRVVSD